MKALIFSSATIIDDDELRPRLSKRQVSSLNPRLVRRAVCVPYPLTLRESTWRRSYVRFVRRLAWVSASHWAERLDDRRIGLKPRRSDQIETVGDCWEHGEQARAD